MLANGFEINGKIVDTMVAAALIDENRWSFSLNACAKDYLGEIKNETFLKEKAKEWGMGIPRSMENACWIRRLLCRARRCAHIKALAEV